MGDHMEDNKDRSRLKGIGRDKYDGWPGRGIKGKTDKLRKRN